MNTTTLTEQQQQQTTSIKFAAVADLAGRIALAAIFLLAGVNKVQYYDANAQFLASGGLPEFLLPFVIVFEVVGALMIIAGFKTRLVALAFAGFSVVTALMYHSNLADQMQFLMFFKNLAIAGGFLTLVAHGAGNYSLDAKRR